MQIVPFNPLDGLSPGRLRRIASTSKNSKKYFLFHMNKFENFYPYLGRIPTHRSSFPANLANDMGSRYPIQVVSRWIFRTSV